MAFDQKAYNQAYYKKHRRVLICRARVRSEATPEATAAYFKDYYRNNRESIRVYKADYHAKNGDEIRSRVKRWNKTNRVRVTAYYRNRRHTDPAYAMEVRLRNRLGELIRKSGARKAGNTVELLGCSVQQLVAHIESLFLPGMSWENRSQWHIDHKRPCKSFDLTDPVQQRACFHFSNLQPLWGPDNLRKGAKFVAA